MKVKSSKVEMQLTYWFQTFRVENHLGRTVERREVGVKIVLFDTGSTDGRSPDLHRINGNIQFNNTTR